MKKITLSILLSLICSTTWAFEFPQAEDAWLRAAPESAKMTAAYLTLDNPSDTEKTLIAAYSPAFGKTELHRSMHHHGMAKMVKQQELIVPAKQSLELKPGGLHIMLMMPKRTFSIGEKVKVCLIYRNAQGTEEIQIVEFPVKKQAE